MNTNMTGFKWFSEIFGLFCFGQSWQSCFSIGRVKGIDGLKINMFYKNMHLFKLSSTSSQYSLTSARTAQELFGYRSSKRETLLQCSMPPLEFPFLLHLSWENSILSLSAACRDVVVTPLQAKHCFYIT